MEAVAVVDFLPLLFVDGFVLDDWLPLSVVLDQAHGSEQAPVRRILVENMRQLVPIEVVLAPVWRKHFLNDPQNRVVVPEAGWQRGLVEFWAQEDLFTLLNLKNEKLFGELDLLKNGVDVDDAANELEVDHDFELVEDQLSALLLKLVLHELLVIHALGGVVGAILCVLEDVKALVFLHNPLDSPFLLQVLIHVDLLDAHNSEFLDLKLVNLRFVMPELI